ncbi:MFS transporter [Clostridium tagluense]|uniref:MFS transporter n=1 Tax=Clostridium tagluense TaxID=360422 RepID=UPI001C0AA5DC|nr:MFS transporter [Clostridium tagluense]MBU3130605.1 MFS transporter [Clostridium tagluense]MCB2314161.1 MFS transporter [Clostridium tagluense]MCB2319000.1 MFS transporter [Clostridium tagluense]MCB2323906.1 MFS transporter [Clostridium tagluense]MCB2328719.1 MFS transporter [Clostridium tagluense]
MKNKNNAIVIIFLFIAMALNAMAENTKGIFIPSFKLDFNIDNTGIGIMIFIGSLAYISFSYIGGILCEKIGQKRVIVLGLSCMVLSLALMSVVDSYTFFLINMFIMNIGLALTSISINTLVPVLLLSYQAILMNIIHFCYGVGGATGQALGGILMTKGFTWRNIYLGISLLFVILLIAFTFIKMPHTHKYSESNKINKLDLLKNKIIYFYVFALGFYVFSEVATVSWLVNYIKDNYKYNSSKSAFYSVMFLVIFSIGRLVGGFVVEKLGYLKTTMGSLIIAVCLFTLGLVVGEKGLIIISVSGLFFAITFPTLVLTISKVFKQNTAYITGVIVTLTSSINMLLNLVIGKLNDRVGTYFAFYMIPISLIISIIFIYLIYINTKSKFTLDSGVKNEQG